MNSAEKLSDFVARSLAAGRTRDQIAGALADAGWSAAEIQAGLSAWNAAEGGGPPVPRPQPYLSAREAFFHAILFTALVASAGFLVALGFALIDNWLPDLDGRTHYYDRGGLRWNIAALVVAMAAFLLLDHQSRRGLRRDAGQARSSVRKWFGYVMLFLAAVSLAGDLVAALYTFLNGAFSAAVAARVALVAVTAGLIFGYFLSEMRDIAATAGGGDPAAATGAAQPWLQPVSRVGLVGLVGAMLAVAIWDIGGPGTARQERRDMARLEDLQNLARAIECTADLRGGILPQELAIDPACSDATRLADPFTGDGYSYGPLGPQTYRLCAAFERPEILIAVGPYGAERIDPATGCLTQPYFPPEGSGK